MNERIKLLANHAGFDFGRDWQVIGQSEDSLKVFAELIVREMCGLMEQAEDDAYHCFEPSERPTEYINWLRDWQERFVEHFGVEE